MDPRGKEKAFSIASTSAYYASQNGINARESPPILSHHLLTPKWEKYFDRFGCSKIPINQTLNCKSHLLIFFLFILKYSSWIKLSSATYPSVSSESWFHTRDIGKGTASVMENSLTLNAGERIAHFKRKRKDYHKIMNNCTHLLI